MRIILFIAVIALVGAGCQQKEIEKPKEGCDKYVSYRVDDCRWCEENGGRYMSVGFGVNCVFPPTQNNK